MHSLPNYIHVHIDSTLHSDVEMKYTACTYGFIGAHGEEVCHEGGEAGSEAALRHKAQLQLSQTHGVIASLPVPARNIQKVSLPTGDS